MITEELVTCLARFFDRKGPSHDELSSDFRRVGLQAGEAVSQFPGEQVGKMRRVRAVLTHALDHNVAAGDRLIPILIARLRATGSFRPAGQEYAGTELIEAAREAFRHAGYELDFDGNLRQSQISDLDGPEVTEALKVYVRRAQLGSHDAALVAGTSKDLLEATARHVLVETTGSYPETANFGVTLYHAFDRLGLCSSFPLLSQLDRDPRRAIEQSLYLLANAVNRLRNAEGTGHGRPFESSVTDDEASLVIQAMGLISQFLLNKRSQVASDHTAEAVVTR